MSASACFAPITFPLRLAFRYLRDATKFLHSLSFAIAILVEVARTMNSSSRLSFAALTNAKTCGIV